MIGIYTFWNVPNYGAFSQAYALNNVVRNIENSEEVYHIGYLHPAHHDLYYVRKKPVANSFVSYLNPKFYKKMIEAILCPEVKYTKLQTAWNEIPHINFENKDKLESKRWDSVILGSDCIWEYSVGEFGDDIHLIGNNLNSDNILSYAASFGNMNVGDNFREFVADGLKKLNFISVRDKTTYDIVKNLSGRESEIVLDPTFLWDFKNDEKIIKPIHDNYILVYGGNFDKKIVEQIKDYAKKNNLTIIGAGSCPKWCDIKKYGISPFEWLGYFKYANCVATCMFHGLMFSINFNKKVYFNQVEYVKNRSQWLLEVTGLEKFNKQKSVEYVFDSNWDYEDIENKLSTYKIKSLNYLKKSLGHTSD
jgi:hypothetical protein